MSGVVLTGATGFVGSELLARFLQRGSRRVYALVRASDHDAAAARLPDLRRVFEYHGAEHKTISNFEAEEELTPENAARFSDRKSVV